MLFAKIVKKLNLVHAMLRNADGFFYHIVKGGMRQGRRASTTELVPALRGKHDGVMPPRRSTLAGFCPQARGLEKR